MTTTHSIGAVAKLELESTAKPHWLPDLLPWGFLSSEHTREIGGWLI